MKKIILLLLISVSVKAQYLGADVGLSSLNPVCGIYVGYENKVVIEGQILTHIDNVNAAYFGARAGYLFDLGEVTATPLIGVRWKEISTDKKELNKFVASSGIRIQYKLFTCTISRMDANTFLTIGVKRHL